MRNRSARFDNLRFFLVLTVVLGHLVELFWREGTVYAVVYRVIYCFHAPALMFVSGWFARFDRKKLLKRLLLPYLVFQVLYRSFAYLVLHESGVSILSPFGHLWYLLVLAVYLLLLPLLPKRTLRNALLVVGGGIAAALLAGYDASLGYSLSGSRLVVFFPFFAAGYYGAALTGIRQALRRRRWLFAALAVVCAAGATTAVVLLRIPTKILYGSCAYAVCGGNIWQRALFLAAAFSWIAALLLLTPNRRLPVISAVGRDTMPVYLLHGFVVKLLPLAWLDRGRALWNLPELLLIALLCMLVFGNPWVQRLFALRSPKKHLNSRN